MGPMIARRQNPALKLGIPVLVFAVLLGAFTLANHSGGPTSAASGEAQPAAGLGRPARNTEELIARLQRQVRAQPGEAAGYAQLGDAYLQRTRQTGDFGFYVRAERSFDEALRREPGNATAIVGAGTLALARHDFDQGLRLGRRALALAPETVRPYAVIVDGQVELGRYAAARRSLQRMVDLKPNLASYSRVSYLGAVNEAVTRGNVGSRRHARRSGAAGRSSQPQSVEHHASHVAAEAHALR